MTIINQAALERSNVFQETCSKLDLSPRQLGYLFGLGDIKEETSVRRKLRDSDAASFRLPTQADVLAVQLLLFLKDTGYDLTSIDFDKDGQVIRVARSRKSK